MNRELKFLLSIACVVGALTVEVSCGWTQQEAQPAPAPIGQKAVKVVLKHYAMNRLALDPKTGKPLPNDGSWSIGKTTPAACPQTTVICVEVFYQVPAESVQCSWVVMLNGDGSDGTFLDENDDAEQYLLRKATQSEAKALVDSRKKPIYPPIAVAAHVSGAVPMEVLVGKSGEVQKIAVMSGPAMVQQAAADAAKGWSFKPLMVGTRAVPFETQLVFTFRTTGPPVASVDMEP